MCERCNDVGYLSVRNGDDSIDCPDCNGVTVAIEEPLSVEAVATVFGDSVVAEYTCRYCLRGRVFPLLVTWITEADRRELESLRDDAWYRAGWYSALGHDRYGRSYRVIDSEADDDLQIEYQLAEREQKEVEIMKAEDKR